MASKLTVAVPPPEAVSAAVTVIIAVPADLGMRVTYILSPEMPVSMSPMSEDSAS